MLPESDLHFYNRIANFNSTGSADGSDPSYIVSIGDQDGSDDIIGFLDGLHVKFDQEVTSLDFVAVLDHRLEILPIQSDRIQTDVDQQFYPLPVVQIDGVTGIKYACHGAVEGGVQFAIRRKNRHALTQDALGEGRVIYIADGLQFTVQGSVKGKFTHRTSRSGGQLRCAFICGPCFHGGDRVVKAHDLHQDEGQDAGNRSADNQTHEGVGIVAGRVDAVDDGQETAQSGINEIAGTKEGGDQRTDGSRDAGADERLLESQVDTINDRLGNAKQTGNGGRQGDVFDFLVPALEEDGEACNRLCAHADGSHGLDRIIPKDSEVLQLDRPGTPMGAEDHERLEQAAQKGRCQPG